MLGGAETSALPRVIAPGRTRSRPGRPSGPARPSAATRTGAQPDQRPARPSAQFDPRSGRTGGQFDPRSGRTADPARSNYVDRPGRPAAADTLLALRARRAGHACRGGDRRVVCASPGATALMRPGKQGHERRRHLPPGQPPGATWYPRQGHHRRLGPTLALRRPAASGWHWPPGPSTERLAERVGRARVAPRRQARAGPRPAGRGRQAHRSAASAGAARLGAPSRWRVGGPSSASRDPGRPWPARCCGQHAARGVRSARKAGHWFIGWRTMEGGRTDARHHLDVTAPRAAGPVRPRAAGRSGQAAWPTCRGSVASALGAGSAGTPASLAAPSLPVTRSADDASTPASSNRSAAENSSSGGSPAPAATPHPGPALPSRRLAGDQARSRHRWAGRGSSLGRPSSPTACR